ncbi:acyl-CoA dehydrogenase family protein, partial [Candidatus Sumerlaeota bacterium]|nr:acyl-CoA dehydrogenase family protein [Candidatus Sumerlaeota bacterium]
MQFGLSEEQKILTESISRYLQSSAPLERTRRFAEDGEARAEDVWTGLCELGVPGLMIDEEHGGIGLSLLDAALLAETLGYHVAPAPFVASVVMAPLAIMALGSEAQRSRWLPALAEGSVVAGAGLAEMIGATGDEIVQWDGSALNGKASFVLDFEADAYVIADKDCAMYWVEAEATGLTRQRLGTIDKTRHVGELVFENVAAERLEGSGEPEARARVVDAGRIILAADTLGAAQNMLDQAVAYAKERVQFGRVIGSFQAVKHMCAEMAAELEPCRAMMWYAAHAFDAIPGESRLTACHTKAHLAEVGKFVAKTSTEVHGGMG